MQLNRWLRLFKIPYFLTFCRSFDCYLKIDKSTVIPEFQLRDNGRDAIYTISTKLVKRMKRFLHFAALAIANIAIAVTFPSLLALMQAVSAPILLSQNVNFKPPDVTAPDNRQGATHRGDVCPKDLSIIPLMPRSNLGLTVADSPTVFAYISETSVPIEFTLQNQDQAEVYKTTLKLDKPGIIEVQIPAIIDNKKSIEVGKQNQWSFSAVCNPDDRSGDYYVKGLIQRIETKPTLKNDLANPELRAKLLAYSKNEIWYDTLATLAQMRRLAPENSELTAEWTQLLQSQELESVADQPLIQSF